MVIREMRSDECFQVLARARLARLACAREDQPYIVPVYLAYDAASRCLYGFTTVGQKIEWMRANPKVCVEVDEVASFDQWVSVIVLGRYEETQEATESDQEHGRAPERAQRPIDESVPDWFADSHYSDDEREQAWKILQTDPTWQEPGVTAWTARPHRDSTQPLIPIFYRIRIENVTGQSADKPAVS